MKKSVKKPVAKKAAKKETKPVVKASKPKKAPAKKPSKKKAAKKVAKKPALKIAPFPEAQLFDQTAVAPKPVVSAPAAPVSFTPQFVPVQVSSSAVPSRPSNALTTISELFAREKHSGNIAAATLPTWQP